MKVAKAMHSLCVCAKSDLSSAAVRTTYYVMSYSNRIVFSLSPKQFANSSSMSIAVLPNDDY